MKIPHLSSLFYIHWYHSLCQGQVWESSYWSQALKHDLDTVYNDGKYTSNFEYQLKIINSYPVYFQNLVWFSVQS